MKNWLNVEEAMAFWRSIIFMSVIKHLRVGCVMEKFGNSI